jgi:uncharacterized DUF497 family protein
LTFARAEANFWQVPIFGFDPDKSARTKADPNRGIDFIDAQKLWNDPDRVEIPSRTSDERRVQLLGVMDGKHWSVIVTPRDEKVRIISVRRMRKDEKEIYESRKDTNRGGT